FVPPKDHESKAEERTARPRTLDSFRTLPPIDWQETEKPPEKPVALPAADVAKEKADNAPAVKVPPPPPAGWGKKPAIIPTLQPSPLPRPGPVGKPIIPAKVGPPLPVDTAVFLGSQAQGRRFCFIADCSGSMQGTPLGQE